MTSNNLVPISSFHADATTEAITTQTHTPTSASRLVNSIALAQLPVKSDVQEIMEIDFRAIPICFNHLELLTAKETKYQYDNPTTGEDHRERVRWNKNGVEWPTEQDYIAMLDPKGFEILKGWPLEPVIIYANQKKGNWHKKRWNLTQDVTEGSVCVDGTARAALVYLYDYLFEVSDNSHQSFLHARNTLIIQNLRLLVCHFNKILREAKTCLFYY